MNIKTKLDLGVGLLFSLILALSIISVINIQYMKSDTDNILIDNYNSLQYCKNILIHLEERSKYSHFKIEQELSKQELNITEIGEKELTIRLRAHFNKLKSGLNRDSIISLMKSDVFKIMEMNMETINKKSEIAKNTADKAVFWIVLSGSLCFLIAFILLINLPSNISNPISELSESIKQIAANNYTKRLSFEGNLEFEELANSFNTMAQKLDEYEKSQMSKLMMAVKRTEMIIENIHDPVIGLDENLRVIFANSAAAKICGLSKPEIEGKLAQQLANRNDLFNSLIKELMIGEVADDEKEIPLKVISDGKENYFEKEILHISIIPTGENTKRLVGHVILLRNVTVYKELDFAKTAFIATVSHEFKTPISSIKLSLELLENKEVGHLNEEQAHLLQGIKEDTNRLLKITGDLLNMTQVESGKIQLAVKPISPKDIILDAIKSNKKIADSKHINIIIHVQEKTPQIMADNEKSIWILSNLISNAIRYSHENSEIKINVVEKDHEIKILVIDSGQGIAVKYKDKIFDRYFRIPGSQIDGTGLGLAICKEFMNAQGGDIEVESEVGVGSTFTLTFNKVI